MFGHSACHSLFARLPFAVGYSLAAPVSASLRLLAVGCSNAVCATSLKSAGHKLRSWRSQSAFTLIEVLLVLVILGVMVTVMLPQVMSSLREHELRGATRVVMSAARHAMSLAVLSQRQMSVVYDFENTTLTIRAAARPKRPVEPDETGGALSPEPVDPLAVFAEEAWRTDEGAGGTGGSSGAYDGAVAIVDEEVVHAFNGIRFSFIEVEGEDGYRSQDGIHTILYYTNGRCTPHTIGIEDDDGATATIEIDALCSARVLERG